MVAEDILGWRMVREGCVLVEVAMSGGLSGSKMEVRRKASEG